LEGYELDIVDYLLKPFSFERFLKAVNKALKISQVESPTNVSSSPKIEQKVRRVFLYANKKHYQIVLDDLIYVEASGNYTKIVLKNETITIREKLSSIKELLPVEDFVQVHRSFLIAVQYIKSIEGNQIFLEDETIPVGKSYKAKLIEILNSI
jgi:DNA-binding LytR/AlgR family response regulator